MLNIHCFKIVADGKGFFLKCIASSEVKLGGFDENSLLNWSKINSIW